MSNHVAVDLDSEISQLKTLLEKTAKEYHYNFRHPIVLRLSQELDGLIIKAMKSQPIHR